MTRRSNPFATRYIAPGAIPFLFADRQSVQSLVDRLPTQGWWGQIVGPHGSGKSSLLGELLAVCDAQGRDVRRWTLRDRQRRLPMTIDDARGWSAKTLVAIDGYEQLSSWSRFRLKRWCRRQQAGLLVTAHRDCGLPELYRTGTNLVLFQQLVAERLRASDCADALRDEEIAAAFARCDGNVREAFLELFDRVQPRRDR